MFQEFDLLSLEVSMYKNKNIDFLDLSEKQKEALSILVDSPVTVLLFGGAAGGGKSWLGVTWLIYNCLSFPDTRWFIGRVELKRVRSTALRTFYKACKKYNVPREKYKFNGQDNYIEFTNGSRIDLLDLKLEPSDPLFEDLGSEEFTGGFIEEGGEVDFDAFDTLKSRIGRQNNSFYNLPGKILITSNPKKNWLYTNIYKPFMQGTLDSKYAFVQSLATDNPFLDENYLENLNSISNTVKRERLKDGIWEYSDDDNTLCDFESISYIFKHNALLDQETTGLYISVDVARFGKDKTVIIVWKNFCAIEIRTISKSDTKVVADTVKDLMKKYTVGAKNVVIDGDGIGGSVIDQIPTSTSFNNGATPIETGGVNENFANLKTQCYFLLAEAINKKKMYVKCDDIKMQEIITEELEQIRIVNQDSDGKVKILSKGEIKGLIGRSPDYSDALMMRFYYIAKHGWSGKPGSTKATVYTSRSSFSGTKRGANNEMFTAAELKRFKL